MYPRRPKLSAKEADSIFVKISEQIILGARSGEDQGIPIIGGLPLVRNFWELSKNPECLWLNIDFEDDAKLEYEIKFDNSFKPEELLSEKVLKTDNEIIQLISKKAKSYNINEAVEAFRKIKMESMSLNFYSSFAYMGGYKPIYFFLK